MRTTIQSLVHKRAHNIVKHTSDYVVVLKGLVYCCEHRKRLTTWFLLCHMQLNDCSMCAACTIFATGFNIPDDIKKGCCVVYTIQLDENGCTHTNDCYGFSITFPPGSLLSNQKIILTIGVMTRGPFVFPDNVVPISPILWVCGNCCDVKLLKNATIVLQHCLDIEKRDDRGIEILFMKAHVNHHCIVSGNKRRYVFESVGNAAVLEGHNAESLTSHFCSFCLATKMSDTLKEQTQYCITLFADKANSKCVFAVTYLLKACIQVKSMQKPRICITIHIFQTVSEKTMQRYGVFRDVRL